LAGDYQLALSYFDVFVHVVCEAAPPGAPKPIADAELVWPEGPAKERCFCPCCENDLAVTGPGKTIRQFCLSMKKRKAGFRDGHQTSEMYDIRDGIIVHLTMERGGTVTDRYIVDRTPGFCKSELGVELQSEQLRAKAAELGLRIAVRERDHRRLLEATELSPQSQEAPGLLSDFGELTAILCLQGGPGVAGGLSARGLANGAIHDWSTSSRLLLVIITIGVDHLIIFYRNNNIKMCT
jgi:hypothetical protein